MSWTTTPITAELLRGFVELEHTERGVLPHRLPAWARAQAADGQLAMAESQPAGVRLLLRTAATAIELDTIPTKREYVGAPTRPDGVYDVVVDGRLAAQGSVPGGDTLVVDMATGGFEHRLGESGTLRVVDLPSDDKRVEIWLPHDETTVLVALRTDAPVRPVADTRRVWLHHGSSISQGSNAAHPTGPASAKRLGYDPADVTRDVRYTRYLGPTGPTRASLFAGVDLGPYSREANFDGRAFNDQSTWGGSVEMTKDFGAFSLTSITAYRAFEVEDNNDADGGPLALLNINSAHQEQDQFTQELRISSPTGQRLEYVAGLFYFDQDVTTTTGGAARVMNHMEDYLQTEWSELRVFLTSITDQYAVIAIQGPRSLVAVMTWPSSLMA